MIRNIFIILLTTVLISCKSTQLSNSNIKKTNNKTDKLIENLLDKNRFVFFKRSTYSTYAYVWVHHENELQCYVVSGVNKTKMLEIDNCPLNISDEDVFVIDNIYPYRLDGDIIGYAYYDTNKKIEKVELPCDIDEFMEIVFPKDYKLAIQLQCDYSKILKQIKDNLTISKIN